MRRTDSLAFLALLALTACAGGQPADDTAPAPAPTSPADAADLYDWLQGEQVPSAALQVELPPDLVAGSLIQDEPRFKVGVTATVEQPLRLAGLAPASLTGQPLDLELGAIRSDGGTGFVWSATVESPGAAALRLGLDDFYLPTGAELYLYDDLGEVAGPYTHFGPQGDGAFWTNTLRGDRVHLQIHYGGTDLVDALGATALSVVDVGHLDERLLAAQYSAIDTDLRSFCSFNASCVENAECQNLPAAVAAARDAVALMIFASGPWQYICSGGLMADADHTGTPHFITANHCISSSSEAGSLETYFQFSTSCGGSCSLNQVYNTLGATIESTSSTSDYTLLLLSGAAPAGSQFLDQNPNEIAFSNGADLFRISHPGGAPQAYSTHDVDTSKGTCSSWPRGNWIYSTDKFGATEGGSSGSPVVDANGLMVGQLSGACGFNVNDNCDTVSNATVDGAFYAYQDDVAQFLGSGGGTCTDADGDGWCVEGGDCDDANATTNPGASEVCGDLVDNDCDGSVDEGCGSPTCEPVGDPCSSAADCCSNKCKGRPGGMTCK
jgi:hypothetical protein